MHVSINHLPYLFWLDIAIEICPKLKDGRSASVANHCKLAKNRCPTASPCRYTLHSCRISNAELAEILAVKIIAANAKKCHTFSILPYWKNLGNFCTFLGVEPAVAAASASGSSQSWWIFIHQKMDATKMDATNQPLGVLSVFLGLFAFRPFFHLWELRFGRLRSQWDDWITRDFKHLKGGRSTKHY